MPWGTGAPLTSCHYINSTSHHIYVPFRSIKKIKHWHDDFCYTCNGMTSHVHRCLWTYAQLIGVCLCVPRSWHIGTGHWKQASVRFTSMINFILREHFCELKSRLEIYFSINFNFTGAHTKGIPFSRLVLSWYTYCPVFASNNTNEGQCTVNGCAMKSNRILHTHCAWTFLVYFIKCTCACTWALEPPFMVDNDRLTKLSHKGLHSGSKP